MKPRQPVKLSSTTCLELSAARALRRSLVSWPCATKPNHKAKAKCAASAWFLGRGRKSVEKQGFEKNRKRPIKEAPERNTLRTTCQKLIKKVDQGPASQRNNFDLEVAPLRLAPTEKAWKAELASINHQNLCSCMSSLLIPQIP